MKVLINQVMDDYILPESIGLSQFSKLCVFIQQGIKHPWITFAFLRKQEGFGVLYGGFVVNGNMITESAHICHHAPPLP